MSERAVVSCFGGGGAYGIGFNMGVAIGMRDEGINLTSGPMIGTSAGGYAVAALALGMSFETVAERWREYTATHGKVWVRTADLTEPLFGDTTAAGVGTVALRLWRFRRVVLWADDQRLSDVVAASASPVPFARPHRIEGRRYVDGGMRRLASADLAPAADLLVLVTPLCGLRQGYAGRSGAKQAAKETARWRAAAGGDVVHVQPSDSICDLRLRGMQMLGDMTAAAEVFQLARVEGHRAAKELRSNFPQVVERLRA
jgi:NTE family protein